LSLLCFMLDLMRVDVRLWVWESIKTLFV
jgi:hypothetical protein